MRFYLLMIIIMPAQLMGQNSLYDITLYGVNGKHVNMAEYKGKKIVVAAVSPSNLKNGRLAYLDFLQRGNRDVIVIAVPASDYKGVNDSLDVDEIKNNSSLNMLVAEPEGVKKDNGKKQNRLLQWLTNVSANTHFDLDVTTDDQLYFISESGVLYAVLEKGAPEELIKQLLKQEDVKH